MATTNKKVVRFKKERETKHAVRYEEEADDGQPPVVGTLYLKKWFVGNADEVTATIEVKKAA